MARTPLRLTLRLDDKQFRDHLQTVRRRLERAQWNPDRRWLVKHPDPQVNASRSR